jgi:3-dehydroquinate synthase
VTDIRVNAGGQHYDVVVGPLAASAHRLRELARERTLPVVSDARVWELHGRAVRALLAVEPILVPEGEEAKQWPHLQTLIARLAELNLDRSTPVLALGGGSVGDLTALAAGLFKRGCPVVHLPTTLLAQADSAVGGKTAIDAEGQKNLVGLFHQPALVLADPALLDTLDERQLRAGYAEVVKYGLIDDPAFFAWCEANGPALLAGHRGSREQAITSCIRAKARTVEHDVEDRSGTRALLNLGHTFAHAIESAAGLGTVLHGEAVALGMAQAHDLSAELGLCPPADAARIRAHLASAKLPTTLAEVPVERSRLPDLMGADKKNEGGKLKLVLTQGIGRAFLSDGVDSDRLADFLARAL